MWGNWGGSKRVRIDDGVRINIWIKDFGYGLY